MPAVYFQMRWPDKSESQCYSPSTVIKDFFTPGTVYPLAEFMQRANDGLHAASDRVREKFGFACSSAMDQLGKIEHIGRRFDAQSSVEFIAFH